MINEMPIEDLKELAKIVQRRLFDLEHSWVGQVVNNQLQNDPLRKSGCSEANVIFIRLGEAMEEAIKKATPPKNLTIGRRTGLREREQNGELNPTESGSPEEISWHKIAQAMHSFCACGYRLEEGQFENYATTVWPTTFRHLMKVARTSRICQCGGRIPSTEKRTICLTCKGRQKNKAVSGESSRTKTNVDADAVTTNEASPTMTSTAHVSPNLYYQTQPTHVDLSHPMSNKAFDTSTDSLSCSFPLFASTSQPIHPTDANQDIYNLLFPVTPPQASDPALPMPKPAPSHNYRYSPYLVPSLPPQQVPNREVLFRINVLHTVTPESDLNLTDIKPPKKKNLEFQKEGISDTPLVDPVDPVKSLTELVANVQLDEKIADCSGTRVPVQSVDAPPSYSGLENGPPHASKFYAVRVGRNTGVYSSWDDCRKQVKGFSGAEYKSFKTFPEAQSYLAR
ncbi:hypothetical protein HK100_003461 [Physocladia obscura]|uniref:Ribonuclease H n=1 Tax=Physocladia obscura TaxID=109957 RepID=A0AAD5XDJ0_9FUNG|nr:hypothetical protein HK100_003461 [Physocladia obscura]